MFQNSVKMANNRNCHNHTVYQAYDEYGNKDDRFHKYSIMGNGRAQFQCFQCGSPWEDYQRFKKHCREVHGYEYESEFPPTYPWNFSDPDSKYQRELREVKAMIERTAVPAYQRDLQDVKAMIEHAAAKRKAEDAVGQNEMEPKVKSFKTTHSELISNVNNNYNLTGNNNCGDPGPSRVEHDSNNCSYDDDYRKMIVLEGKKKKAAMKKKN